MADITSLLDKIKSAKYGRDVRSAIHDGIRCCYDEGKAGTTDLFARGRIEELRSRVDNGLVVKEYRGARSINEVTEIARMIVQRDMAPNTAHTVGIVIAGDEDPTYDGCYQLRLYSNVDSNNLPVLSAELIGTNGHRLLMQGKTAEGATVSEMTFTKWEWENPPLRTVGEEYKTNERYQISRVYTQLIRLYGSQIPVSKGENSVVKFEVDSLVQVVSISGMCHRPRFGSDNMWNSWFSVPYRDAGLSIEAECSKNGDKFVAGLSVKALEDIDLHDDTFTSFTENDYLDIVIKYIKY